jgi:hypothetical protein
VQSAGGGGAGGHYEHRPHQSLHTGFFHGVDNASEIRDLIIERLRRFRETGLGDPDEAHRVHGSAESKPAQAGQLSVAAAAELLHAARQLRQAMTSWTERRRD